MAIAAIVLVLIIWGSQFATAIALARHILSLAAALNYLGGRNVDDGRLHLLHNRGKGARKLHGIGNRQRRSAYSHSGMRRADMAGNHRAN